MAKSSRPNPLNAILNKKDLLQVLKEANCFNGPYDNFSAEYKEIDNEIERLCARILNTNKKYQELKEKQEELKKRDRKTKMKFTAERNRLMNLVRLKGPTPKIAAQIQKFLGIKE